MKNQQQQQGQQISLLEIVFFVMMVVPQVLPRGNVIDAAHARNAALFRLAMSLVGLIGFVTVKALKWLKRRQRAAESAATVAGNGVPTPPALAMPVVAGSVAADPSALSERNAWDLSAHADFANSQQPGAGAALQITIPYRTTRNALWRTNVYVLLHSPPAHALAFFLFPLLGSLFLVPGLISSGVAGRSVLPMLLLMAGLFAGWVGFFFALLLLQIQQRLPRPDTVRMSTARLTPDGFYDVMPEKTAFCAWNSVRAIREHEGDIYVWWGFGTSNVVPREGFADQAEARRFYEAALTLWKSKGTIWPAPEQAPELFQAEQQRPAAR